jgi:hypothetical protein
MKYYRDLVGQRERIEAFRRAIHAAVKSGDKVLDVGSALGTFAFFAADAGAGVVWAVDTDPVIHVAKAIGRLNGYEDRVEFIRGWVPDVETPGKADVIIFEDFPPHLMGDREFRLLRALHERYAAAGVRTVPQAGELYAAPVSSEALQAEVAAFGAGETAFDIDWSPSREYVVNTPLTVGINPAALVAQGERVGTVRFTEPPELDSVSGSASWSAERDADLHGLAYWFELDLGGQQRLSNAPGAEPGSWGHLFLPIDPPLEVRAGSQIRATVGAAPRRERTPGWLTWKIAAHDELRTGHAFRSSPASLADMTQSSPDSIPSLDSRGELELKVLALTDGTRSIRDIAGEMAAERGDLPQAEAERLVAQVLRHKIRVGYGLAAAAERGGP